ncbi:hypothetical protein IscW_ISCW021071, partial [Ixodes scapularis]
SLARAHHQSAEKGPPCMYGPRRPRHQWHRSSLSLFEPSPGVWAPLREYRGPRGPKLPAGERCPPPLPHGSHEEDTRA